MINDFSFKGVNSNISTLWESKLKASFKVNLGRQRENQVDEEYEAYRDI
jgi:hypothetical protein